MKALTELRRGDLLPRMMTATPGPRARELSRQLGEFEAPGINTLYSGRPNILWQEARGANVLDVDGNRYIDLTSGFGVAAIGHRHPKVLAALRHQSGLLLHGLGDATGHERRIELAERLCQLAPLEDPQVYFAVSGADAVEVALKTALLATGRPGIVAFDPAYHGTTLGALAGTSRREFRRPFAPHLHDHLHRLPFACNPRLLDELLERHDVGGVLVEPIVGREGVLVPPPSWLDRIAELCRIRGTLLIADEIFTGFGRTGAWFAVESEGVRPDLLCCGKALAGGMPIAAVLGRRQVLAAWRTTGEALHTATFLAHPPACAAALANLAVLHAEGLPDRAARLGRELAERLAAWQDLSAVVEVRGRGLLWGLELRSREIAARLCQKARDDGILLLVGGPRGRVAQIVPPLSISRRQLEWAATVLESLLKDLS